MRHYAQSFRNSDWINKRPIVWKLTPRKRPAQINGRRLEARLKEIIQRIERKETS